MHITAAIFNCSSETVQYLISFKRPNKIIQEYRFNVELIAHLPTSMHASGEGHECYIFKRCCVGRARRCCRKAKAATIREGIFGTQKNVEGIACDALFYEDFLRYRSGRKSISKHICKQVKVFYDTKPKRNRKQVKHFCPGS